MATQKYTLHLMICYRPEVLGYDAVDAYVLVLVAFCWGLLPLYYNYIFKDNITDIDGIL